MYDGDIIEIQKIREVDSFLEKQARLGKSNRFREVRINEMIDAGITSADDQRLNDDFTNLNDDENIAMGIENEIKERWARKEVYKKQYKLENMNRINFESRF